MKCDFKAIRNGKRPPLQGRLDGAAGFTLIEVICAMSIIGIVIVSLYAGLAQCFSSVESARHRLRATQILGEKLEVIRLYNWNQITNGYVPTTFTEKFQPGGQTGKQGIAYTGTITLTNAAVNAAYNSTMRKAIMRVTWASGAVTHQLSMETLISQYGIQNYVY